jgi:hypothetical protein
MFKAIGWLIKLSIFAGIILVLGNMLHWRGRTVSDQVKTSLAAAQQSETLDDIKTWANHMTSAPATPGHSATHLKSAKKRALPQENPHHFINSAVHPVMTSTAATQPTAETEDARAQQEEIPSSERQKLRALIRELNTSQTN